MLRNPPTRLPWGLLVVMAGLLVLSSSRLPAAQTEVYPMVFPLLGEHTLTDSFGDPRGRGRSHEGVDILADRMVPVVAVADGVVRWIHDRRGGNCCDVALVHDDGWRSRYIHLNNDTPGTDDGRAVGIAPGISKGSRVSAGQVLGWVGDSGNAEATTPHLHFELRRPDGSPIDPLPSLKAALEGGRSLVPEPPAAQGEGDAEEGGRRRGLWRRLMGRDRGAGEERQGEGRQGEERRDGEAEDEPQAPPAPPMPPDEGEPQVPIDDPLELPAPPPEEPVTLAENRPGSLPGLAMERRVEEVPVEQGGATAAEDRRERRSGPLACFGFASGSDDEPERGAETRAKPETEPTVP